MAKWPWIERTFTFQYPIEKHPDIIERFAGLPARAEDRTRGLSRERLVWSDGKWSILENIGHLLSLEELFDGRIDDYLAGRERLRAADMTNLATRQAAYNQRDIGEVLSSLRAARAAQWRRLIALDASDLARVAVHPRLGVPMRLIDAVCFVCEHDDYHMARVAELRAKQGII